MFDPASYSVGAIMLNIPYSITNKLITIEFSRVGIPGTSSVGQIGINFQITDGTNKALAAQTNYGVVYSQTQSYAWLRFSFVSKTAIQILSGYQGYGLLYIKSIWVEDIK